MTNKMKNSAQKPVFQFSSIKNESISKKLKDIVLELGGEIDESKIYSEKATHLIVGEMNCTEKLLGFIAGGKWILTQTYLKTCALEKRFVDETDYHISKGFTLSQLANVSKKWKENIENKISMYPFKGWVVGIFISNEAKAQALHRIINSGQGKAIDMKSCIKYKKSSCTLIIHDEDKDMINQAKEMAKSLSIPCYPSQSIADYIMECVYNPMPLIPITYYNKLLKLDEKESDKENVENMEIDDGFNLKIDNYESFFLNSFKTYLTNSNINKQPLKFMDTFIESQVFDVLWKQNAFENALFFLNSIEPDNLPNAIYLQVLLHYLMENQEALFKHFASDPEESSKLASYLYNSIYSYVLNKILTHPPECRNSIEYYKKTFEGLQLGFRSKGFIKTERQLIGFVDILHLISIHDYLLLNNGKHLSNCALVLAKLSTDYSKVNLIKLMVSKEYANKIPFQTFEKVLQILALCDKHFDQSFLMKKARKFLQENHKMSECLKNDSKNVKINKQNNIINNNYNNQFFVDLFNYMLKDLE